MPIIKPFKAVGYNPEKVPDFTKVVSPPYDVISPDEQAQLHNLSPFNFTHIDLGLDKPTDNKDENKYTRAKVQFDEWLKKKVLIQDAEPAVYFYRQEYTMLGQKYNRLGFIAAMKLEGGDESSVRPHENTHAHAVDDRLRLTKAVSSNLSSIFVCYSDKRKKVEQIFNKNVVTAKPLMNFVYSDGIRHKLWRLTQPAIIKEIDDSLLGQNLFIADGHHRYQVALDYQRWRSEKRPNSNIPENFDYVMTYFTNIDSKDLLILPYHRIVKKLPRKLEFLEEYFRFDRVKNKDDLMILLARAGRNEHAFGLYTPDGIYLLRLRNKSFIDDLIKEGSFEYRRLDTTLLKYFVFDKMGIPSEDIVYSKDYQEAVALVDNQSAQASFILNPVKISQLQAVALNGEKMPPKSTYFYPKILSGLTVYKMD